MRSLPMLKCSSDRWVCAPHSLSAGTLTSPRLSVSLRTSATRHLFVDLRHTMLFLLSPARGRGWVRGLYPSSPPHLTSPLAGERNMNVYSCDGLARSDLMVP